MRSRIVVFEFFLGFSWKLTDSNEYVLKSFYGFKIKYGILILYFEKFLR